MNGRCGRWTGAEAAAAPGQETTEEAGATAGPGTPPRRAHCKVRTGVSGAACRERRAQGSVCARAAPVPGLPQPAVPFRTAAAPAAGWGLLSLHQSSSPRGSGVGGAGTPRATSGCPGQGLLSHLLRSQAPGPILLFPTLPRGLDPPLGPLPGAPPTRGGPSPPRHSHSGATPTPGRHRTLTRAADTKRRPRVPAMLPTHRHRGTDKTAGRRRRRRGPHGGFITVAAHKAAARDPRAPGGRGRGRMQQCDTVKRGRGDTGRGRTRGGAQPPTRTGRPGSGKGEKRDSYFL